MWQACWLLCMILCLKEWSYRSHHLNGYIKTLTNITWNFFNFLHFSLSFWTRLYIWPLTHQFLCEKHPLHDCFWNAWCILPSLIKEFNQSFKFRTIHLFVFFITCRANNLSTQFALISITFPPIYISLIVIIIWSVVKGVCVQLEVSCFDSCYKR